MQDFLIALLIGLVLGWLVEWLIDWQYWRPTVTTLRQENQRLRQQIEALSQPVDDTAHAASVEADSSTTEGN